MCTCPFLLGRDGGGEGVGVGGGGGGGGEAEPPTKFSKTGGLTESQFLERGSWERGR